MYLDHNATAPLSEAARHAITDAWGSAWGNTHSPHRLGQDTAVLVEVAREQIARLVGRPAKDVTFTSGATEANTWALSGARHAGKAVVASAVEHPSVLAWATHLVPVDDRGIIDLDALKVALDGVDGVVSVMLANNETGVVQPVEEVARIAREADIHFHCDASQGPGRIPVAIDADSITLSAHKFGGPVGVGALIAKDAPEPLFRGGPQERERRAGTVNAPGAIGMGAAAANLRQQTSEARDALEAYCAERGARILGMGAPRLPNTLSVLFPVPGDLVVAGLDLEGFQVSTGSACTSGSSNASHVVAAMGLEGTPVRFSLGPDSVVTDLLPVLGTVLDRLEAACAS